MCSTDGARAEITAELVKCVPPLEQMLRSPAGDGAMFSTAGARALMKARANAVNSTTGTRASFTCTRRCDVFHR